MRKLIYYISILFISIFVFSACTINNIDKSNENNSNEETENNQIQMESFYYNSTKELMIGLKNDFTNETIRNIENAEKKELKGTFEKYINNLKKEEKIYVPYYKGQEVPLRNDDEFSNIILMPSELFEKPWIWYYTKFNNELVIIKVMDSSNYNTSSSKNKSASELRKLIAPNAPNIDNYKEYENYEKIYEKEIIINGSSFISMISVPKDSSRIHVSISYGDSLVIITGKESVINDEWFADFSLETIIIN